MKIEIHPEDSIYAAVFGQVYATLHINRMERGHDPPDEGQQDIYAEEADAVAKIAVEAWKRLEES